MGDLTARPPDEILDVLGRPCPYPIVLIKSAMEQLSSGAILKVLCDSQITVEEVIPHYCERRGYGCAIIRSEDEGHWEIYIEKR